MIFVSHSEADKAVVVPFRDTVLLSGFPFEYNDIFCSSAPGSGFDAADYIDASILEKIRTSELIILLFSHRYLESTYCLAEMGAIWGLRDACTKHPAVNLFPILLGDLKYSDVPAMWERKFLQKMDEEGLESLYDMAKRAFPGKKFNTTQFRLKSRAYRDSLPDLMAKLPPRNMVTRVEHDKVLLEKKDAEELAANQDNEITLLKQRVEELRNAKDPAEVARIDLSHSNAEQVYEVLLGKVRDGLKQIPYGIRDIIFNLHKGSASWRLSEDVDRDDLKKAIKYNLIEDHDEEYKFSEETEQLKYDLSDLDNFISHGEYHCGEERKTLEDEELYALLETIKEKTGIKPNLNNMAYWETFWKRY